MDRETLEQKLALAPKYGQNQAWLLLNSVLAQGEEVQDNGPGAHGLLDLDCWLPLYRPKPCVDINFEYLQAPNGNPNHRPALL